jgi:hypothetical protein
MALGVGVLLAVVSIPAGLSLHQHFVDSLASQVRHVKVTMEAPGASTVRVHWDDPALYPRSHVTFPVVQGADVQQIWHVKMESLRERNAAALHNQLRVFSIRTPEQELTWKDIALVGNWTFFDDQSLRGMDRKVGVTWTTGIVPNGLSAMLKGSRLTVVVARSEYGGKVRITVNGVSQTEDLYLAGWDLPELTFFARAPMDYGARTYGVFVPRGRGRWNRLEFVRNDGAPLDIRRTSVDGLEAPRAGSHAFALEQPRWPAYRLARLATATVCVLLPFTMLSGALLFAAGHHTQIPADRRYEHLAAASFAASMAFALTMLFYPGILNEDAVWRWKLAMKVLDEAAPLSSIGTWWPPLMTLTMLELRRISGEFGLPTFLQAFFFYFCLALLAIDLFGRRLAVLLTPLIAMTPVVVMHAVLLSPDTGMAIALMACILLICRRRKRRTLRREIGGLFLFLLSCVFLFGLRYNSPALLPLLIAAIWILFRSNQVRAGYVAVAVIGAVAAQATPWMIGARAVPASALYLLWDHVGILKVLNDDELTRRHRLDHIGDTARAISIHDALDPANLLFGKDAPFPAWVVIQHAQEIRVAFWRLAWEHPLAFLINRAHNYAWLLGLRGHLYRIYYFDLHSWGPEEVGPHYGFYYIRDPGSLAMKTQEWSARIVNLPVVRFLFYPWSLLAALGLAGTLVLYLRLPVTDVAFAAGLALVYYGTFFIFGAGAAFRYYFPSFMLFELALLACMLGIGRFGVERLSRRRRATRRAI